MDAGHVRCALAQICPPPTPARMPSESPTHLVVAALGVVVLHGASICWCSVPIHPCGLEGLQKAEKERGMSRLRRLRSYCKLARNLYIRAVCKMAFHVQVI